MATTTCPVFYPTEAEFQYFGEYVNKIDQERGILFYIIQIFTYIIYLYL